MTFVLAASCLENVNGILIWSEIDSWMTWIHSLTWTWSRSESGYVSGNETSGTWTLKTLKNESWSEKKIFLYCENGSGSDCLHVHCCVSLVPFSSWLSSWP